MDPQWCHFHVHWMALFQVLFQYHFAKWYHFLQKKEGDILAPLIHDYQVKMAPLYQIGTVFPKSSSVEAFWLHFFQCMISITEKLFPDFKAYITDEVG